MPKEATKNHKFRKANSADITKYGKIARFPSSLPHPPVFSTLRCFWLWTPGIFSEGRGELFITVIVINIQPVLSNFPPAHVFSVFCTTSPQGQGSWQGRPLEGPWPPWPWRGGDHSLDIEVTSEHLQGPLGPVSTLTQKQVEGQVSVASPLDLRA